MKMTKEDTTLNSESSSPSINEKRGLQPAILFVDRELKPAILFFDDQKGESKTTNKSRSDVGFSTTEIQRNEIIEEEPEGLTVSKNTQSKPLTWGNESMNYPAEKKLEVPSEVMFTAEISPINQAPVILNSSGGIAVKQKTPAAYTIAQKLMGNVSFIIHEDGLYYFDGSIYRLLNKSNALRLIMHFCREHAKATGDAKIIKSIYETLYMEPRIMRKKVDEVKGILAFRNGHLTINTGEFKPSTPDVFITSCLDLDYIPVNNIECPYFESFLYRISGGDSLLIYRFWEVIGYYLTADMDGKCFAVCQGVGDSGKSTLGEFIQGFFSDDAITSVDINSLRRQFSMAELVGKRLNCSMDLPAEPIAPQAISSIKQLTGRDLMTADVKYMPPVKFKNTCKLLYSTNHEIQIATRDDAFLRRMIILPFNIKLNPSEINPNILSLFKNERLAIVLKALTYYKGLVERKYQFSGNYRANENIEFVNIKQPSKDEFVKEFVLKFCKFTTYAQATLTRVLYAVYSNFVDEKNRFDIVGFSASLNRQFAENLIKSKWREEGSASGNPENGYKGIILK